MPKRTLEQSIARGIRKATTETDRIDLRLPPRLERAVGNLRTYAKAYYSRQGRKGALSKVHDWSHVEGVARHAKIFAEEMARAQGLKNDEAKRIGLLAEATGYAHDLVREKTEEIPHGPASGEKLRQTFIQHFDALATPRERQGMGIAAFTLDEARQISKMAAIHEGSFKEVEEATKEMDPAKKIVAKALVIGDKVAEASGYRVLERRAYFVGKERFKKDLAPLEKEYGENAPLYAVAMESCIRLRARNALGNYPSWVWPIAQPLHKVQEEFYYGLLKRLGMDERQLLAEMKRIGFPATEKYEKSIGKNIPRNTSAMLKQTRAETAAAAEELVRHFASSESPEKAIETMKPKTTKAAEWLEGIKGYRNPDAGYEARLRTAIRRNISA